jgi:ABC-2 type transport system permease protein
MIRVEFIRQLRRARTWGHIGALAAVPILVGIANYVEKGRPGTLRRNLYFLGTNNAVNFGIFMLLIMSNFFIVVVVASLSGESVSGEATWGTLRYLLIRPVRRSKLILAKVLVATILAFAATFLIVIVSVAIGALLFGWHDVLTIGQGGRIRFDIISPWEGLWRLGIATVYVGICMLFVVAVGIFLSTLTDSTAAAVVGTIVVAVTCGVLLQVPSLEGIRPVVPTKYWGEYNGLFNPDGTSDLWKGIVSSLSWSTIFVTAALVRFQRKDITS